MFTSVLIANRGEIALRIQRACKALGIESVQAHSQADADAAYVRSADRSVCIGPAPAAKSYLDKFRIVLAAKAAGAQAIHPGYGFLSENAEFASLVNEAGLTFIGPPPSAIEKMGDKIAAKETMLAANVPCVPGLQGEVKADPETLGRVKQIGFPVIVKAAGGGGGRGMRVVRREDDLLDAIVTTSQEAKSAFSNPTVYVERYLERPRHVEVQVLGDKHGNYLWIGARDCSTQRRHQKVIEEAPAPGIDPNLLRQIGERCISACRMLGYVGLGTFEFLFEDGNFYFIEMNTRLQVEHTVTEMVTGLDLVQLQLRVAGGENLDIHQADVEFAGHSLECRINAENPDDFTPSAGRITFWQPPGGPGLRVDSHVSSGYVVPPYYDSMIAKLISYGRTRSEAIARMEGGLRQFAIVGVRTNIPLLQRILASEAFQQGGMNIHFLENFLSSRDKVPPCLP